MTMYHRPKIRFNDEDPGSCAIEAQLQGDGRIRFVTDPDALHNHTTWMDPKQVREFALELLGLCDASETIYPEETYDLDYHTDANVTCPGPGIKCVCWDLAMQFTDGDAR